jgi:hypothetical protein
MNMSENALHGLLLDCGFRNLLWTPLRGQKWAVVGEVEVGVEITVSCTDGPTLHVPSETARDLLVEMLAQNGAESVAVMADKRRAWDASPWVPLAIGAGAVALFGWVISTINR